MTETKSHQRVNEILLGPLERPALQWLAANIPSWMTPDVLTIIGILGSLLIFASYWMTNINAGFLWVASLGLVINWFGDSLDGTVARYRRIERPKYGFFVDHTVDAFSQLVIVIGLGLSPYVTFEVACLALIGYLLMSVLVYVRTYVDGVFQISYGKLGPTEVRAILIMINVWFFFFGNPTARLPFGEVSVNDVVVGLIAAALLIIFVVSTTRKALELSKLNE